MIIDQVKSAEGFMNNLNSDHNKIDPWLWGLIATSVDGLGSNILSESTGVSTQDVVATGSLFIGGLIVASSPGERGNNIIEAILNAGPEKALLKVSLDLMVSTLDTLKRPEDFSKKVHEFWNGMLTNVMILQDMNLAAAKRLGEEILKSDSTHSSTKVTKDFGRNIQNLLAILNRDGINQTTHR
ncbi:hypothetical protein N7488_007769 [Penicillium malachiteum]|nr:hypothetical protein N7488_007769 [Penicillium malachiteum]